MSIEGPEDIEALRRVGIAVAQAREAMGAAVRPGISTAELDGIGLAELEKHGARSAPRLAYEFPGTTCISVNDEIAHGIPSGRILKSGDLVNIDVSAELDGYWADSGASFPVGRVSPRLDALLCAAREALETALRAVRVGDPMSRIGRAVQQVARRAGFSVVRNLCGHGVGRFIHEAPQVLNTEDTRDRTVITEGLVFTIEPFLTTGATMAIEAADGWTLKTPDGSIGAQFEHTLLVTSEGPLILT